MVWVVKASYWLYFTGCESNDIQTDLLFLRKTGQTTARRIAIWIVVMAIMITTWSPFRMTRANITGPGTQPCYLQTLRDEFR
jgi:hypothetical protein